MWSERNIQLTTSSKGGLGGPRSKIEILATRFKADWRCTAPSSKIQRALRVWAWPHARGRARKRKGKERHGPQNWMVGVGVYTRHLT